MSRELQLGNEQAMEQHGVVRKVAGIDADAWLVDGTLLLERDAALNAIRTGRLPDGTPFDPYRVALVQKGVPLSTSNDSSKPAGRATVVAREQGSYRIDVEASRPAFVVLAQSFYPGWRAHIDGVDVPIVVANTAFQGVAVPAGRHTVVFSFLPTTLMWGFAAAIAGTFTLVAYAIFLRRTRRKRSEVGIRIPSEKSQISDA